MAIDTEPITFSDLVTDFINRTRGSTAQTATTNLAKRYINLALQDLHISPGSKFPWQCRRAVLQTNPPYSTGTVSILEAFRTSVNGSGMAWKTVPTGYPITVNNVNPGGKITFGGTNEVYEVATVTSDTSLTLATRYIGTALTNSGYSYYEDEYELASDFKEFVDLRMFSTDCNIPLIGSLEFRRRYPRNNILGRPKVATHIQLGFSGNTSPRHRVVFSPVPDDRYAIPYWYVTTNLAVTAAGVEQTRLVNDTDEPIVPVQFRHAITFGALFHYYRDFKDDARSQEAKAEYTDLVIRISGQRETGAERPQLVIPAQYPGGRRTLPRFDLNGRFSRLDW